MDETTVERLKWLAEDDYTLRPGAFLHLAGAGLARLRQHILQGPFAILTSEVDARGQDPRLAERENQERKLRFKRQLLDHGYGWLGTKDAWASNGNGNDKNPEDPESRNVLKKRSMLVPGLNRAEAQLLAD